MAVHSDLLTPPSGEELLFVFSDFEALQWVTRTGRPFLYGQDVCERAIQHVLFFIDFYVELLNYDNQVQARKLESCVVHILDNPYFLKLAFLQNFDLSEVKNVQVLYGVSDHRNVEFHFDFFYRALKWFQVLNDFKGLRA